MQFNQKSQIFHKFLQNVHHDAVSEVEQHPLGVLEAGVPERDVEAEHLQRFLHGEGPDAVADLVEARRWSPDGRF